MPSQRYDEFFEIIHCMSLAPKCRQRGSTFTALRIFLIVAMEVRKDAHRASSKRSSSRCNDYGNYVDYADYSRRSARPASPSNGRRLSEPSAARRHLATDRARVIRRLEDGTNEFTELRWGFPPAPTEAAP